MTDNNKRYISLVSLLFFTIVLYIVSFNTVRNSIYTLIEKDGEEYSEYLNKEYVERLDNSITAMGSEIRNLFIGVESDSEIIDKLDHFNRNLLYRLYDSDNNQIKKSEDSRYLGRLTTKDRNLFNDKKIFTRAKLIANNRLIMEFYLKVQTVNSVYYIVFYYENFPSNILIIDRVPPPFEVKLIHSSGVQLHPPKDVPNRRPNHPRDPLREEHQPPPKFNEPSDRLEDLTGFVKTFNIEIDVLDSSLVIDYHMEEVLSSYMPILWVFRLTIILSFLLFLGVSIIINGGRLRAFDHNSLTHLPGNRSIIRQLEKITRKNRDHMIIYCDLDNFKAYNDVYGFTAGDSIILFSARLLKQFFPKKSSTFVGHIGGDDFVIIGEREYLLEHVNKFGMEFDKRAAEFYNEEDRKRGYITTKARTGEVCKFPLISMSMGGVELRNHIGAHHLEISEICAEVKKEAKKQVGSTLYIDKRIGR